MAKARDRRSNNEQGFSLLFALLIAFGVAIAAVAVNSRAFFGVLGAAFSQDARRARDAAEIGATRILSELNREPNRMLLAMAPANNGPFWTTAQAASADAVNACAALENDPTQRPATPNLLAVATGGAAGAPTTQRPVVYLNAAGVATASNQTAPSQQAPGDAVMAYRLESVELASPPGWFRTDSPAGPQGAQRGLLRLRVTGFAYTNGVLSGTTALEETIEVLPKCCQRSLGGNNYPLFGSDLRACDAPSASLGFVFNVAATGGVEFTVTGSQSEIESDGGTPVEPLACIGTAASPCPASEQIGNQQDTRSVLQIDNNLTPIADILTAVPAAAGALEGCADPDKGGGPADLCTEHDLFRYESKDVPLVMDAVAADLDQLPDFCNDVASSYPVNGSIITCRISSLNIANGDTFRIRTSDARRVRLYFSASDQEVIALSSGSRLEHAYQSNTGHALLALQLFGCEPNFTPGGCSDQRINVDSNSIMGAQNPLFLYFPRGAIGAGGGGGAGSQFNGVFWFDSLQANGNVEFTISSNLASLLRDLNMAEDGFATPGAPAGNPPMVWEYVVRAVRGFRLF